jgi:hypothetical protein
MTPDKGSVGPFIYGYRHNRSPSPAPRPVGCAAPHAAQIAACLLAGPAAVPVAALLVAAVEVAVMMIMLLMVTGLVILVSVLFVPSLSSPFWFFIMTQRGPRARRQRLALSRIPCWPFPLRVTARFAARPSRSASEEKLQAEYDKISAELEKLEAKKNPSDADQERASEIEDRLYDIECERPELLKPEQMAAGGVFLEIEQEGTLDIQRG